MKITFSIGSDPQPVKAVTGAVIRSSRAMPVDATILRQTNARMLRMYEAAITDNTNVDFPVSITSANSEIMVSINAARSRARKSERDDPYGASILNLFQDNVGGPDPFRLEMKVGKKNPDGEFIEESDTNEMIEEAWEEAGLPENCTVRRDMSRAEVYWQAITATIRDGGILARHYPAFPKNDFRYAIDPIETDRLDHYYNRALTGSANEIQFSMELDEYQGVVFYHILTRHPGDVYAYSNQARYRERVPAEDIIALFDIRTRAGQFVAVPRFSSIIQRLHQARQFDKAHVTAAIWSACKPLFILQDFPTAMEQVPEEIRNRLQAMSNGNGEEGEKLSGVSPGEAEVLDWGKKPFLVDPKFPIEAASGFKKDQLRAAAAGSGAPYHMIVSDLEGVNFSSGRLGENQFHDTCKKLQNHIIVNYVRRHFNKWLAYAMLSGQLKLDPRRLKEFQKSAVFYGRRWPYINPLQDAQADILRIEAGLTSRSRVIAESDRGGDVETVDAEIASDRKCDEAHDLDFTGSDPTEPATEEGEPGEVEGGDVPTKPKKGGKQTITKPGKALHDLLMNGFHRNGNGHHDLQLRP